jgi:hypothetical protein
MGGMLLFRRAILLPGETLSSYQSTHAGPGFEGGISERQYVALNGESGRRMERRRADGWGVTGGIPVAGYLVEDALREDDADRREWVLVRG